MENLSFKELVRINGGMDISKCGGGGFSSGGTVIESAFRLAAKTESERKKAEKKKRKSRSRRRARGRGGYVPEW
jgi:hypothetical protein